MRRYLTIYLCTLLILAPLDFAVLASVGNALMEAQVGDMLAPHTDMVAGVLFYVVYGIGIVALVNGAAPGAWRSNAARGAVLGFTAYATFDLTNLAVLKHWEWAVAVPDILWGTVATAISAALGGLLAARLLGPRHA